MSTMAALSTTHTATTTLTPPSSSHGDPNGFQWDFAVPAGKPENLHYDNTSSSLRSDYPAHASYKTPFAAQNGNVGSYGADTFSTGGDQVNAPRSALSRAYSNNNDDDDDTPDTMADADMDHDDERQGRSEHPQKGGKESEGSSDEESKWIHRDKLAKIESEELQAAGIILPQPRSRSRPARERSVNSTKRLGGDNATRSRKNSINALEPKTPESAAAMNGWEVDEADLPARPTTSSRIPVPKKSPLPISSQQSNSRENSPDELEKRIDMPKARSRSGSTTLKGLEPSPNLKAQPPKRVATDTSPKKTPAPRKGSAPSKTIPPEARGKVKPKGKNGNGNTRPSTRSGERELSMGSAGPKPMEGEPPWMVSAYKPDPRLPPDQQLLPTVARRLQQEKWEQEGKFGTVYDKDFRPLTDEGFLLPPQASPAVASSSTDNIVEVEIEPRPDEWPLRSPEAPKSPMSTGRSSTYSTMPKIQDKPPSNTTPKASPRLLQGPVPQLQQPPPAQQQQQQQPLQQPQSQQPPQSQPQSQPMQITRVPDVSEKENAKGAKKKEGGCACCIVM